MRDIEFLYLTQADVRATGVDMAMAMDAVEDAFRLHHQGQTNLPYKTVLDLGERERGRGNAMPAYVGGEYDVFGIKWIAGFPKNPQRTTGCPGRPGSSSSTTRGRGFPWRSWTAPCCQRHAHRGGDRGGGQVHGPAGLRVRGHDRRRGTGPHAAGGAEGGASRTWRRCEPLTSAARRPRDSPQR